MGKTNFSPLDDIELTEEQASAFIEKLQEWKDSVHEQLNEKAELIQEEIEENVEEKYSAMFEEAKQKMQEVYANRLDESLKELYSVLKEKTVKDLKENPEFQLVEKVKDLFAPFIVEEKSTEGIQALKEEKRKLQEELDLIKANKKLDSLLGDLDEDIAEKIKPLIGEFTNEEEVVEQFAKAYELMKVTSEQVLKESQQESEFYEEESSDLEDLLDEYAENIDEGKMIVGPFPGAGEILTFDEAVKKAWGHPGKKFWVLKAPHNSTPIIKQYDSKSEIPSRYEVYGDAIIGHADNMDVEDYLNSKEAQNARSKWIYSLGVDEGKMIIGPFPGAGEILTFDEAVKKAWGHPGKKFWVLKAPHNSTPIIKQYDSKSEIPSRYEVYGDAIIGHADNMDVEDYLQSKEAQNARSKWIYSLDVDEGIDPDPDPIYNIDPDGKPYIEKKNKSKKGKKSLKESEEDDDALLESILNEEDYDEDIETDGEQKISFLNEEDEDNISESEKRMRALAGIK